MRTTIKNICRASLFVAAAVVFAGCGSTKPVAWNIQLTKNTPASIEVDIVGIAPSEKLSWMNNVKVDDYWKANSSIRKGTKKFTTAFQSGSNDVVKVNSPLWKEWFSYGATEIMIVANLPGQYEPGPYDLRRLFLPLDKKSWKTKNRAIKIEIQEERIRVLTPQITRN
jgi:hypothetical protein